MRLILFACLMAIASKVQSQEKSKASGLQRYTIIEAGLVNGDHTSSFAVQGRGGLKINKTLAGVGAGIDGYRLRSVPVFLDLQQEFGKTGKRFFVYANGGYNFPWVTVRDKSREGFIEGKFDGGIYYDGGVGIKLQLTGTNAVVFSGGYSRKKLGKVYGSYFCPWGTCQDVVNNVNYSFSRIVFRAGWQF